MAKPDPNELTTSLKKKLGKLTKEYFTLKYRNTQLEAVKKINNVLIEELAVKVHNIMEDEELEKISTEAGSMSRGVQVHPNIKDLDKFLNWVFKTKAFEFLPKSVNAAPVREMLIEKGVIPPGLDTYEKKTLSARISSSFREYLTNQ